MMQSILTLLETILLVISAAVGVSYVLWRYETGNGEHAGARVLPPPSKSERAAGIAGEIAAAFLAAVLYPLGYILNESSQGPLRPGERPVILCHGYMHNRSAFILLRRRLKRAGWSHVVAPNFGPASAAIPQFAVQLADTVNRVRLQTGCEKVDLVGHSMGGLVVRYFIHNLDGGSLVHTAVTLGAPNRGTKTAALGLFSTARQFRPDNPLIAELWKASGSGGSVTVVAVLSEFDNIVLPPENARLPEPCANRLVRNVGHIALLLSAQAFSHVRDALAGAKGA